MVSEKGDRQRDIRGISILESRKKNTLLQKGDKELLKKTTEIFQNVAGPLHTNRRRSAVSLEGRSPLRGGRGGKLPCQKKIPVAGSREAEGITACPFKGKRVSLSGKGRSSFQDSKRVERSSLGREEESSLRSPAEKRSAFLSKEPTKRSREKRRWTLR